MSGWHPDEGGKVIEPVVQVSDMAAFSAIHSDFWQKNRNRAVCGGKKFSTILENSCRGQEMISSKVCCPFCYGVFRHSATIGGMWLMHR